MIRSHLDLRPEDLKAICDSREQRPLALSLPTVRGTLATGDYSISGLEHLVTVERKSLSDLIGVIGVGRERFEREVQRLLAFESKAVVVECSWATFVSGGWRSRVTPSAAMGSVIGWEALGIPFHWAANREDAAHYVSRFLFVAARRRWRELQSLIPNLRIEGAKNGVA